MIEALLLTILLRDMHVEGSKAEASILKIIRPIVTSSWSTIIALVNVASIRTEVDEHVIRMVQADEEVQSYLQSTVFSNAAISTNLYLLEEEQCVPFLAASIPYIASAFGEFVGKFQWEITKQFSACRENHLALQETLLKADEEAVQGIFSSASANESRRGTLNAPQAILWRMLLDLKDLNLSLPSTITRFDIYFSLLALLVELQRNAYHSYLCDARQTNSLEGLEEVKTRVVTKLADEVKRSVEDLLLLLMELLVETKAQEDIIGHVREQSTAALNKIPKDLQNNLFVEEIADESSRKFIRAHLRHRATDSLQTLASSLDAAVSKSINEGAL